MKSPIETTTQHAPYLAADDPCLDGEWRVDPNTLDRDLEELLADAQQTDSDRTTRTTWMLSDGRRIGPEWVPQRLMRARKAWLDDGRDPDLFWILADLLHWAGRDPNGPEEHAQLQRLREQAEQLLGAAPAV